jgi:hypothetical protein
VKLQTSGSKNGETGLPQVSSLVLLSFVESVPISIAKPICSISAARAAQTVTAPNGSSMQSCDIGLPNEFEFIIHRMTSVSVNKGEGNQAIMVNDNNPWQRY